MVNFNHVFADWERIIFSEFLFLSGRKKGATLKMSGVSINAPSVLKAEKDLEPLAVCVPADTKQQKS